MTDAYQRSGGGTQGGGLYQTSGSLSLSYNGQAAEKQTYAAGTLSADTVNYSNGSGGSSSQTASNSDNYTTKGWWGATTTGTDFNGNSGQNQWQSNNSGTVNMLTNTSSANSTSSTSNAGSSFASSTSNYGDSSSTTSLLASSGNAYAFSALAGCFNANGMQTSGTSYNFTGDGGQDSSFQSSLTASSDYPTATYQQTVSDSYGGNAFDDLSANADGCSNGILSSSINSITTADSASTRIGTQQLGNGTAAYNNSDFNHEVYYAASNTNLGLWAGQVNGATTWNTHDNNSENYSNDVQTNLRNGALSSTALGSGWGSTVSHATDISVYANGTPTLYDTAVVTENGGNSDSIMADGS